MIFLQPFLYIQEIELFRADIRFVEGTCLEYVLKDMEHFLNFRYLVHVACPMYFTQQ